MPLATLHRDGSFLAKLGVDEGDDIGQLIDMPENGTE